MHTQTRTRPTAQSVTENEEVKPKNKHSITAKRNALVEISNISNSVNLNGIRFTEKLKFNGTKTQKPLIKINRITQLKKKLSFTKQRENLDENKNDQNKPVGSGDIENIDEFYRNKIFLAPEYAEYIYNHLRSLEEKFKIKKWPLNSNVSEKMRSTLVDWLIDVHVEYDLIQETLHLAVSLIDRYLQVSSDVNAKNLQLIGICCLAIATKYEEVQPLSVWDFLYLCNNAYNKKEFIEMEKSILRNIGYEIARPVTISFLRRYSLAGKAERLQHIFAKYILDLALLEANLCHVKPSLLAACAFFISTCLSKRNFETSYWTEQLRFYSKYRYEHLRPFVSQLSKLLLNSGKVLKSVKTKYSIKEYEFTSNRILLETPLLKTLCDVKLHG